MAASSNTLEPKQQAPEDKDIAYVRRANWLRAAMVGANDGLLSTALLMMGVGTIKKDVKTMILTGFIGLVSGACSKAIGEFVTDYSDLDSEVAQNDQMKWDKQMKDTVSNGGNINEEYKLLHPLKASIASGLGFMVGAIVPLLSAVAFIGHVMVRLDVLVVVVTLTLLVLGWIETMTGRTSVLESCGRVLIGGWMTIAITLVLTKLVGLNQL